MKETYTDSHTIGKKMKLRNKKTGESINFDILPEEVKRAIEVGVTYFWYNYELYQPKEPLIKDKKIRKAVRAWAESFDLNKNTSNINIKAAKDFKEFWLDGYLIEFERTMEEIQQESCFKNYTITELCGEEEE